MRTFSSALLILVLSFWNPRNARGASRPRGNEKQQADDIVVLEKRYHDTARKIEAWQELETKECAATAANDVDATTPSNIEGIKHLPSKEMIGVEEDMLHLCATVAGGVYEAASRRDFEKLLEESNIRDMFPDLTVRFFQNGVTFGRDLLSERLSLNAPTFVGLITGSTLVLGWRGTVTIKDIIADANIDSVSPWNKLQGLGVQKAYYEMIRDVYLKKHATDIVNYVNGKYSKTPNRFKRDGTPITRVLLTGHSLGGGLAQVAHLCMRAPPDHRGSFWTKLVGALKDVDVKTIAISAPMTTVLDEPSEDTLSFLQDSIEPFMRNVVFNADVVPRGYSDVEFIDDFLNAFLDDATKASSDVADQFARSFVNLHLSFFKMRGMMEQAKLYRHVGKLIYYDTPDSVPVLYVDSSEEADEKIRFRSLRYGPKTKVADTALENHMVLVSGPGLVASPATSAK